MFEGAKFLAALTGAVEWYKSHAHILFLYKVIQIPSYSYVPIQSEQGIVIQHKNKHICASKMVWRPQK